MSASEQKQEQAQNKLQQQVNAALDAQVNNMDELTKSRLKAARLKALEQKPVSTFDKLFGWLSLPKAVTAGALSAAVVVLVSFNTMQQSQADGLMAAMNPVLSEEPEMLTDLEFIAWLEQEQMLESVQAEGV